MIIDKNIKKYLNFNCLHLGEIIQIIKLILNLKYKEYKEKNKEIMIFKREQKI